MKPSTIIDHAIYFYVFFCNITTIELKWTDNEIMSFINYSLKLTMFVGRYR